MVCRQNYWLFGSQKNTNIASVLQIAYLPTQWGQFWFVREGLDHILRRNHGRRYGDCGQQYLLLCFQPRKRNTHSQLHGKQIRRPTSQDSRIPKVFEGQLKSENSKWEDLEVEEHVRWLRLAELYSLLWAWWLVWCHCWAWFRRWWVDNKIRSKFYWFVWFCQLKYPGTRKDSLGKWRRRKWWTLDGHLVGNAKLIFIELIAPRKGQANA